MLSSNSISVECILKVIFKVRKVSMNPCDIWTNISETVHTMTNVLLNTYMNSHMIFSLDHDFG